MTMNTALRLALLGLICVGLTGCIPVAAYWEEFEKKQMEQALCRELTAKGIKVTEPVDATISFGEGAIGNFGQVFWRSEVEGDSHPERERFRVPTEVVLAIRAQSIAFVPPSGLAGVRIPYEVILEVKPPSLNLNSVVIIKSVCGRHDIFTFWQQHPNAVDPKAAARAVTEIKANVAAFRATAGKGTEVPQ
jgi:hypothetical protein